MNIMPAGFTTKFNDLLIKTGIGPYPYSITYTLNSNPVQPELEYTEHPEAAYKPKGIISTERLGMRRALLGPGDPLTAQYFPLATRYYQKLQWTADQIHKHAEISPETFEYPILKMTDISNITRYLTVYAKTTSSEAERSAYHSFLRGLCWLECSGADTLELSARNFFDASMGYAAIDLYYAAAMCAELGGEAEKQRAENTAGPSHVENHQAPARMWSTTETMTEQDYRRTLE